MRNKSGIYQLAAADKFCWPYASNTREEEMKLSKLSRRSEVLSETNPRKAIIIKKPENVRIRLWGTKLTWRSFSFLEEVPWRIATTIVFRNLLSPKSGLSSPTWSLSFFFFCSHRFIEVFVRIRGGWGHMNPRTLIATVVIIYIYTIVMLIYTSW